MADAAQHVVDQRPAEQKQQKAAGNAGEEARDLGIGLGARGDGEQPPDEQQEADRVRRTGDAVGDRHHHGEHRPVNRQMRGERPLSPQFGVAHGFSVLLLPRRALS